LILGVNAYLWERGLGGEGLHRRSCRSLIQFSAKSASAAAEIDSTGKADNIQNLISTEFLGEDGKPMSVQDYLQQFYTALPEFFKDEEELRALWSQPETRQATTTNNANSLSLCWGIMSMTASPS
jgi:hypothetical protein